MKKLIKLVRLSSKEVFRKLQSLGDIYCEWIWKSFRVTNLFLRHISGSSKKREFEDIIERLSCISLIEKIAIDWKIVEERTDVTVDKKRFFRKTYKIKSQMKDFEFYIVLGEKKDGWIILISVFFDFLE